MNPKSVHAKSRHTLRLHKQLRAGTEPGLYALTGHSGSAHLRPSNMEYGKCLCELGCDCDEEKP